MPGHPCSDAFERTQYDENLPRIPGIAINPRGLRRRSANCSSRAFSASMSNCCANRRECSARYLVPPRRRASASSPSHVSIECQAKARTQCLCSYLGRQPEGARLSGSVRQAAEGRHLKTTVTLKFLRCPAQSGHFLLAQHFRGAALAAPLVLL